MSLVVDEGKIFIVDEYGAPFLTVHAPGIGSNLFVSVSHDANMVVAVVIATTSR